jgi:hypothetical protein
VVAKAPAKRGSVKKALKKKPVAQDVSVKPRKAAAKKAAAKAKKTPRRAVQ